MGTSLLECILKLRRVCYRGPQKSLLYGCCGLALAALHHFCVLLIGLSAPAQPNESRIEEEGSVEVLGLEAVSGQLPDKLVQECLSWSPVPSLEAHAIKSSFIVRRTHSKPPSNGEHP